MIDHLISWSSADGHCTEFLNRFRAFGALAREAQGSDPRAGYDDLVLGVGVQDGADFILAGQRGHDAARAMVVRHPTRPNIGFVGLYEATPTVDGERSTARVIDAAMRWAVQKEVDTLYAPVDASTWFTYRFAAGSPETEGGPPRFSWEPNTPSSYLERFRTAGFDEAQRYETVGLDFPTEGAYTIRDVEAYTGTAVQLAVRQGFSFGRTNQGEDPGPLLTELHPACMEAFGANTLFAPLSLARFRTLYGGVLARAPHPLTYWCRDAQGRIAGFILGLLDGEYLIVKSVAVRPSFRGRGLSVGLLHHLIAEAADQGRSRMVSALVEQGNRSTLLTSRHKMPGVETWTREYVVLSRSVPPTSASATRNPQGV